MNLFIEPSRFSRVIKSSHPGCSGIMPSCNLFSNSFKEDTLYLDIISNRSFMQAFILDFIYSTIPSRKRVSSFIPKSFDKCLIASIALDRKNSSLNSDNCEINSFIFKGADYQYVSCIQIATQPALGCTPAR